MFAQDRDLLMYEPRLFLDVVWVGQRLLVTTGDVAGGVLTCDGLDFSAYEIGAGHVVNFDGASWEVVQLLGATQLGVSLPRASVDDPMIPPPDMSDAVTEFYTFRHQLLEVHERILRMLGIEPGSTDGVTETSIVNPDSLRRLEALGALHLIFAAASASATGSSADVFAAKAEMYLKRFRDERERVGAQIDTDGDGKADAVRRPTVSRFLRG